MPSPHESLLLEMSEQEFNLWKNNPVTRAYLGFLLDEVEAFRTTAMDLLEAGQLNGRADELKGRILTLRELATLKLSDIHGFYRQEAEGEAENERDANPTRTGYAG